MKKAAQTLQHPIQAVLFDMDGLMLDSERLALDCWREAANQIGAPIHENTILGMVGMHVSKTGRWLTEQLGSDYPADAVRRACHEIFMERTAHAAIPFRPGILELLDWLEAHHITKAVATSTQRPIALHHLQIAGLLSRFTFVLCGDEITHPKPAPDIYLAATHKLGLAPANCLVLEDSNLGVTAGYTAGCQVIMVPDLTSPSSEVTTLGLPIVESLHEVRILLEQMIHES